MRYLITISYDGTDFSGYQKQPKERTVQSELEKALKEMGLTMSSAITMFLVKVDREKRIPFEITSDPFYSESNIRYLEKIASDIKNGKATFSEHALIDGED